MRRSFLVRVTACIFLLGVVLLGDVAQAAAWEKSPLIVGRVTCALSGDPVEGAHVASYRDQHALTALTDAEGRYELLGTTAAGSASLAPIGVYSMHVWARGYESAYMIVWAGRTVSTRDVSLKPKREAFHGTIVDDDTGMPVAADLLLDGPLDSGGYPDVVSASGGKYTLYLPDRAPSGEYELSVELTRFR